MPYFYAVVAYDHLLLYGIPEAIGVRDTPISNFVYVEPYSPAQAYGDFDPEEIYVVPNPVTKERTAPWTLEPNNSDPSGEKLEFRNLPKCRSTVRIYTISGDLVADAPARRQRRQRNAPVEHGIEERTEHRERRVSFQRRAGGREIPASRGEIRRHTVTGMSMHRRKSGSFSPPAALLCGGCSDNVFIGATGTNAPPTIRLVNGPVEQDIVGYKVELSWLGEDRDGKVERYEFVVCNGDPLGFDRQDTTGLDRWTKTVRTDSVFKLAADQYDTTVTIGTGRFSRFKRTHTFFVRAVDDRGSRSEPAYRSFTTWTLAPGVTIDFPPNAFPGYAQTLPPIVRFHWEGVDPRDDPWHVAKVDSIRYLLTIWTDSTVQQLNEHLDRFESLWSPWIATDAPGDSGASTVIGDDEMLDMKNRYVFAVQAKDEAGAVTSIFDMRSNVRVFALLKVVGPVLTVKETFLGLHRFLGTNIRPQAFSLPAEFTFRFTWSADASGYGGVISGYRYGWDVADLSNPNDWEVLPSPYATWAPPRSFSSGVHTLFVEAVDNNGYTTLAQIEISIFPIDMSRNLLWVDDFYSTDFLQIDYSFPTETEHDQFWLRICARARDFNPDRDVFDTKDRASFRRAPRSSGNTGTSSGPIRPTADSTRGTTWWYSRPRAASPRWATPRSIFFRITWPRAVTSGAAGDRTGREGSPRFCTRTRSDSPCT